MSSQKHIQDELRSVGSTLPVNHNHPFSVPEGYFDGLAATILAKVKSSESAVQAELNELSPLLAGIPKQTPYSVPSSYFDANLEMIGSLDGESESTVLAAIGKKLPYSVPNGYFERLPDDILQKVNQRQAKVVPLFARTWMRVASAAAIAGALLFGGYQLFNNKSSDPTQTALHVTNTDSSQKQLAANNLKPIEKTIKQASTKELEDFIDAVQVNPAKAVKVAKKDQDKAEVENLLKDVSVTEMESFLSALPTADDDLFVTD